MLVVVIGVRSLQATKYQYFKYDIVTLFDLIGFSIGYECKIWKQIILFYLNINVGLICW